MYSAISFSKAYAGGRIGRLESDRHLLAVEPKCRQVLSCRYLEPK